MWRDIHEFVVWALGEYHQIHINRPKEKSFFHVLLSFLLYLSSALEFLSTCKLANLTVKAELGCCLLHRSGRLIIDGCILQCESNPLDYLSYAIVTTASGPEAKAKAEVISSPVKGCCVSVSRTRIEGGAKAVMTSGTLSLQRVRVIYSRTSIFFWFDIDHRWWGNLIISLTW